jgi:hypothetical protein
MRRSTRRTLIVLLACGLAARPALAWGPHMQITAAALAVVPNARALAARFGDHWRRLADDYCFMADWREAVRPDHYADDYLIFPGAPSHVSHMLPEVRRAYAPYFRRALVALRTESEQNAARWVGSLLHFVQDSGSPPHTIGTLGELHAKMEQWVDEKQIAIDGYAPQLLGETDDDALRGFLARMEQLVEFSRSRAAELRTMVEPLAKRENQRLALECALETARVTADVLHTLFELGERPAIAEGCGLEGQVDAPPPPGYAQVPAKIMLEGTSFSTTADARGQYRFRNLPAGVYTVHFLATGYTLASIRDVALRAGETAALSPALEPDPVEGNLIRNPAQELSWATPGQPDCWGRDAKNEKRLAAALIRVPAEQSCRVSIKFTGSRRRPAAARWRSNPSTVEGSLELPIAASAADAADVTTAELSPPRSLAPFERGFLFLEILIEGDSPADHPCRHAAVTFIRE